MGSNCGISEITEQGEDFIFWNHLNMTKQPQSKLKECKGKSVFTEVPREILKGDLSKKPIFTGVYEFVAIKQAQRRLCLAQASEQAAMKRPLKQYALEGVPEAARIKRLYTSMILEENECCLSICERKNKLSEKFVSAEEFSRMESLSSQNSFQFNYNQKKYLICVSFCSNIHFFFAKCCFNTKNLQSFIRDIKERYKKIGKQRASIPDPYRNVLNKSST